MARDKRRRKGREGKGRERKDKEGRKEKKKKKSRLIKSMRNLGFFSYYDKLRDGLLFIYFTFSLAGRSPFRYGTCLRMHGILLTCMSMSSIASIIPVRDVCVCNVEYVEYILPQPNVPGHHFADVQLALACAACPPFNPESVAKEWLVGWVSCCCCWSQFTRYVTNIVEIGSMRITQR